MKKQIYASSRRFALRALGFRVDAGLHHEVLPAPEPGFGRKEFAEEYGLDTGPSLDLVISPPSSLIPIFRRQLSRVFDPDAGSMRAPSHMPSPGGGFETASTGIVFVRDRNFGHQEYGHPGVGYYPGICLHELQLNAGKRPDKKH